MNLIDLTHKIKDKMSHSLYDAPLSLSILKDIANGGYGDSCLKTTMHIGTHIDAPSHMIENGKKITDYPIDYFMGQGVCLNFENEDTITLRPKDKTAIQRNEIIIVHTGFYKQFEQTRYYTDYPVVTEAFANFLIENKVKLLVLDFFSPDKHPFKIHKRLLQNDILIVENVTNTGELKSLTTFTAYMIPIKIEAEGAFVRAFVKKIGN